MKKIIIIFSSVFLFHLILTSLLIFPYLLYFLIIEDKYSANWYDLEKINKSLFLGKEFNAERLQEENNKNENQYWQVFHVQNYKVPLPVRHPQLEVTPLINKNFDNDYVQMGFEFLNSNKKAIAEVKFKEGRDFRKNFRPGRLFEIPIFKSELSVKSIREIWSDLFLRKMSYLKNIQLKEIKYLDLVYNLYILSMRDYYFPKKIKSIRYYKKYDVGILEVEGPLSDRLYEEVFFLVEGRIESFSLITKKNDPLVRSLRARYLNQVVFSHTSLKESKKIYGQFRDLTYSQKIHQLGMFYLFSAWSHNFRDKEFLKEIISFLERGEGNYSQLNQLYIYAFEKYGPEFTSGRKQEKAMEDLEKKIGNEERQILKEEANRELLGSEAPEFKTKEEKLRYKLNQARIKLEEARRSGKVKKRTNLEFD